MLYIYGNIYIRITPCRVSLFWALHWAHFCFLQQWPARSIVHVPHIAPHKGASVGLYFVALAVSWLTLIPQSSDSVTGFWSVKCCPLVPHCQVNLIALWLLYKSVDAILATGWVKTGQCSTHGPTFHIFRWRGRGPRGREYRHTCVWRKRQKSQWKIGQAFLQHELFLKLYLIYLWASVHASCYWSPPP